MVVNGGALKAKELEILLKAPYDINMVDVKANGDRFIIDDELSNETTKVFQKEGTNEVFVVHSGSKDMRDVLENYNYITKGFYNSQKLKQATDTQQKAEEKYGSKNISTLGHSKGGKYAEMLGKNTKEIITLNKPVHITDLFTKVPKKQTDIKTTYDPVSFLRKLQRGNKPFIIQSETSNPLEEHKGKVLQRKPNKIYGRGNTIVRVGPSEMTSVVVPERQEEETEDETEDETEEEVETQEEIREELERKTRLMAIITSIFYQNVIGEEDDEMAQELADYYFVFIINFIERSFGVEQYELLNYIRGHTEDEIQRDMANILEENRTQLENYFINNTDASNQARIISFMMLKLVERGI